MFITSEMFPSTRPNDLSDVVDDGFYFKALLSMFGHKYIIIAYIG